MTNNTLSLWIKQILNCLRSLPDGGNADAIEKEWRQYEALNEPVVTIYGPYNAGKSSLLKRLLIDDGKNIPEWLTVKANPTTFKNDEVSVLGCRFRDTPGISNERVEHEIQATEALVLSDAFLLVLLPQLITVAENNQIIPLLTGKFFGTEISKTFLPGSLKLVISRMDEGAGIDPAEGEEAYRRYVGRKQEELQQLLERNHVDVKLLEIHAIAADAYGSVGDNQQPYREDYDHSREWDGVDRLTESLKDLPSQLPELRQKTALRYFSLKGKQELQTLCEKESQTKEALKECDNWVERLSLLEIELNALVSQAQTNLKRKFEQEYSSLSKVGHTDEKEIASVLEPRLTEVYEQWQTSQNSELNKFAQKVEIELQNTSSRPAGQIMSKLLQGITNSKLPQPNRNKLIQIHDFVKRKPFPKERISDCFKVTLDNIKYQLDNQLINNFPDLNINELRKEIRTYNSIFKKEKVSPGLTHAHIIDKYKQQGGKLDGGQITQGSNLIEEFDSFRQWEQRTKIAGCLSLLVMELADYGLMFWAESEEKRIQQNLKQEQKKAFEQITAAMNIVTDNCFEPWKQDVDSFREELKSKKQTYIENKQLLNDEVSKLNQFTGQLKQILSQFPV